MIASRKQRGTSLTYHSFLEDGDGQWGDEASLSEMGAKALLDNYSGEEKGEYSAAVNGWAFWRVLRDNRWVKLEEIRAKHLKLTDYKRWGLKDYPEI